MAISMKRGFALVKIMGLARLKGIQINHSKISPSDNKVFHSLGIAVSSSSPRRIMLPLAPLFSQVGCPLPLEDFHEEGREGRFMLRDLGASQGG
ncbi:hypothetical protein HPP92_010764 [Vanilla planifolia]|uniref:Uncharacterized protein n=1 Tax=Vanilla planifolia TaxID=51239 RepID=A0A835V3T5_VANPL|nr:hypothetical protein HPP92_010764 [Vanilla planifolia]